MATPEHNRRFRVKKRRRAVAAARFERRVPLERTAARDLALLRRTAEQGVLDEAMMLPAGRRFDWLAP